MNLAPAQQAFVATFRFINVDIVGVTESYSPRSLFEGYRGKGIDCVNVDRLQDSLRTGEDDRGLSRNVCLEASSIFLSQGPRKRRNSRPGGGHPNAQCTMPAASTGVAREEWLA